MRVIRFGAPDPAGDNEGGAILVNLLILAMLAAVSANIAALVFARTAVRESAIVVSCALGASRARIAGQLFVEALVLASISAVVGLVGARTVLAHVTWQLQNVGPRPDSVLARVQDEVSGVGVRRERAVALRRKQLTILTFRHSSQPSAALHICQAKWRLDENGSRAHRFDVTFDSLCGALFSSTSTR